ncbi:MAG: outer membrane beta-barrel protein [Melioribacteraceae bacterium]
MKKLIIIIMVIALSTIISAQSGYSDAPFSNTGIGLYGGINAVTGSETGWAVLLNFHANLISNLNLELSAGYSKIFEKINYTSKGFSVVKINSMTFYVTNESNKYQKMYNVIPLSAGLQYMLIRDTFTPYLLANVSYNWVIEEKEFGTGGIQRTYPSVESIPAEYKMPRNYKELTHSTGINAGFGVLYNLSSKINLDFRYLYKSDNKIINTHQFLLGITI